MEAVELGERCGVRLQLARNFKAPTTMIQTLSARQFVLCPSSLDDNATPTLEIAGYLLFTADGVCVAEHEASGRKIVLIGDAIDILDPKRSTAELAQAICEAGTDPDEIRIATNNLCGRWIILFHMDGEDLKILCDASSLFPVFYTRTKSGKLFASSSERFIAQALDLDETDLGRKFSARRKHLSAASFSLRRSEPGVGDTWWPLFTTPYKGLRRLLPHHILVETGEAIRVWPREPLERITFSKATQEVAEGLKAVMLGISQKFDHVRLPITAGLDSRVLLAAAKAAGIDARCYTYAPEDQGLLAHAKRYDLKVGREVATAAGYPHDTVILPDFASAATIETMTSNVSSSIAALSLTVEHEALAEYAPKNGRAVSLNGNVSEVGSMEYGSLPEQALTPKSLATITKTAGDPLAISTYEEWLKGVRKFSKMGYSVLDLLYWEDRMASWQSTVQQQMNQIWSVVTPYNCQALLEKMLQVHVSARRNKAFQKELIKILAPELLAIPLNPSPVSFRANVIARFKGRIRRAAREYSWINFVWWRLRNRS